MSIVEAVNKETASDSFSVAAVYIDTTGINRLVIDGASGQPMQVETIGSTIENTLWYTIAVNGQPFEAESGIMVPLNPTDTQLFHKALGLLFKFTAEFMLGEPRDFKFVAVVAAPFVISGRAPQALALAVGEDELFEKTQFNWDENKWATFAQTKIMLAQLFPVVAIQQ